MIKAECKQAKKFLWGSLVITSLSIVYWLLGISDKLKTYLENRHQSLITFTLSNIFFEVLLPILGFAALVTVHFKIVDIEKHRRYDIEINKIKRFRNVLLIGFIFLMIRGLAFLIFSV